MNTELGKLQLIREGIVVICIVCQYSQEIKVRLYIKYLYKQLQNN